MTVQPSHSATVYSVLCSPFHSLYLWLMLGCVDQLPFSDSAGLGVLSCVASLFASSSLVQLEMESATCSKYFLSEYKNEVKTVCSVLH